MAGRKKTKPAGNVIKSKTFAKKKVKVGKVIKKTTVTNTNFKTRSVVFLQQFADSTHEPTSHRGRTLKDLNALIGHSGLSVRKDAVMGMKQLLSENPELIEAHLFDIVSSISRLLTDAEFTNQKQATSQLKALLKIIFQVPEKLIATPFHVLKSHIRIALTHSKIPVRRTGLEVLNMLFQSYKNLCGKATDLKEAYLNMMQSGKRPADKLLLAQSVHLYRKVYDTDTDMRRELPYAEFDISVAEGSIKRTSAVKGFDHLRLPILYTEDESEDAELDSSFLDRFL